MTHPPSGPSTPTPPSGPPLSLVLVDLLVLAAAIVVVILTAIQVS